MTQLAYSNRPHFDYGAIKEISVILEKLGIKKPLICTDPGLAEIGMIDRLRNQLSNEISPSFYEQTPANPTEEAVENALEIYKTHECDGVIGFGGGSSLDLGKSVALMANHKGKVVDYSINEGGLEKIQKNNTNDCNTYYFRYRKRSFIWSSNHHE